MKKTRLSTLLNKHGGKFTMPGGFKVKVEILDKDEADAEMGKEVLAQYAYSPADHVIQLRHARNAKQRRSDFEHELQHCCIDWVDYFIRRSRK